ncbi:MAG TPA: hypothetical protein VIO35_05590 [Chloroflexota bacterium]
MRALSSRSGVAGVKGVSSHSSTVGQYTREPGRDGCGRASQAEAEQRDRTNTQRPDIWQF